MKIKDFMGNDCDEIIDSFADYYDIVMDETKGEKIWLDDYHFEYLSKEYYIGLGYDYTPHVVGFSSKSAWVQFKAMHFCMKSKTVQCVYTVGRVCKFLGKLANTVATNAYIKVCEYINEKKENSRLDHLRNYINFQAA